MTEEEIQRIIDSHEPLGEEDREELRDMLREAGQLIDEAKHRGRV